MIFEIKQFPISPSYIQIYEHIQFFSIPKKGGRTSKNLKKKKKKKTRTLPLEGHLCQKFKDNRSKFIQEAFDKSWIAI